ncbi:MAG: secreted trypsin-like serine protease [Bacteriovoracaceae bacterium]|jgi:secreted trypsin-like serine protease
MKSTIINNQPQMNWTRFNSTFVIEVKRGESIFTSTAVAIGKRMLLTAAHCVDCADEVVLVIGEDYKSPELVQGVSHWTIHPGYKPSKSLFENDLAVVYLDEDLPNFTGIETISDDILLDDSSILERIGFGGRNNLNVRTWTNPLYQSMTFNKKNFILQDTLSVIGDSGGPIYKEESGVLKLIGIHSTLEGSDKTYIVNLSMYKDWIAGLAEYSEVI